MLKRVLCALLASMMLLGTLASCSEATDDPASGNEETKAPAATGDAPAESENVETREPLDLPALDSYKGKTVTFLTRDEAEWTTTEIFAEKITDKSDNITNAVFERNMIIKEKYGITIKELKLPTGEHTGKITNEAMVGNGTDFQAVITNVVNSANHSTQGHLHDLQGDKVEHLDFTQPWWDTMMAEGMSIHNRLYFATGDLLTLDNDATFMLLFNKKLQADYQIPDLYALVSENKWTMEKFYEYAKQCFKDVKGDGLDYDEDIAGFAYTGDAPYCFLFGGGITICSKDENDYPYYNMNMERAQLISEMGEKLFDKAYALDMNAVTSTDTPIMLVGQTTFGGGHALFFGEVMQSVTRMRGYDVDFGILPFPMYDEAQGAYYSMMHKTASMVSIPTSVQGDKLDLICAAIEAMAYYSVDTLTYQYYEINLQTRDSKDEKSGPMLDRILAGRLCDLSYYYDWTGAYSGIAATLLPSYTGGGISSMNMKLSKGMKRDIDKVVDKMDSNAAKAE